jgi:hypothetical protein
MMLKLPGMVGARTGQQLPGFTRLCMEFGPILCAGLAVVAVAYCLYVWIRKAGTQTSWVAFLATTTSALVLVILPTVVAICLPIIDSLNRLPLK